MLTEHDRELIITSYKAGFMDRYLGREMTEHDELPPNEADNLNSAAEQWYAANQTRIGYLWPVEQNEVLQLAYDFGSELAETQL